MKRKGTYALLHLKKKVLQIIHLYRKNEPLRKQRGSFMKLNQMAYCNNLETICGVWFA